MLKQCSVKSVLYPSCGEWKPEEDFYPRDGRCKKCTMAAQRAYRAAHPDRWAEIQRKTRENRRVQRQMDQLWIKYRLTPEAYQERLDAQGGVCALCHNPETRKSWNGSKVCRLAVDHDHACCPGPQTCGQCIRGLLCSRCNWILEVLDAVPDWFERALRYLGRFPEPGRLG